MNYLIRFIKWLRPDLFKMSEEKRLIIFGDMVSALYFLPFGIVGVVWLIIVTDVTTLRQSWGLYLLFFILLVLFNHINYFMVIEILEERYGSINGSFSNLIYWTSLLILGKTAIWLMIIISIVNFTRGYRKNTSESTKWSLFRNFNFDISTNTCAALIALSIYESLGGLYPIPGLSIQSVSLAAVAIIIHLLLSLTIWSGYTAFQVYIQKKLSGNLTASNLIRFLLLGFGLNFLDQPFSILGAGLYVDNGLSIFLFFIMGIYIVALLTRKFSWAVENNRQQTKLLEQLEQLGQAIIQAPPDGSMLPLLLSQYVPKMFPTSRVAIYVLPDQYLLKYPDKSIPPGDDIWKNILLTRKANGYLDSDQLPWMDGQLSHQPILTAPLINSDTGNTFGGIYIELKTFVTQWNNQSLSKLFPAVQTLTAQISSAIKQIDTYQESINYHNLVQEVRLAGQIQSSFLPRNLPDMDGWQIAVTLLPARETSGDFFDVIPLTNERLGLVIADVMDKGIGPALFMALSRTLLRTYTIEFDAEPDVVLYATNQRLLGDAGTHLFVTAFLGILDPNSGELTYCNAGHNPPFIINRQNNNEIKSLKRTGIALGIELESTWDQETIQILPGDALVLYTDGIPDAQNSKGEFFEFEKLLEITELNSHLPAHQLQNSILEEIQQFVGDTPQYDDISLMILTRDS